MLCHLKKLILMNPTFLKTGDILHCVGNRFVSKLIRKFTKSKFSHSAMFIEIWGQAYIIDAQKDGVNVRPFDAWKEKYNYTFEVHRSPDQIDHKALAIRALTKVGNTAYDFESLLFKHPIAILTNGFWKLKEEEYNKMTCSEYVAWVYASQKAYRVSPEDLYNWCLSNNYISIKF
jgi:uncharacterized protein YycO